MPELTKNYRVCLKTSVKVESSYDIYCVDCDEIKLDKNVPNMLRLLDNGGNSAYVPIDNVGAIFLRHDFSEEKEDVI